MGRKPEVPGRPVTDRLTIRLAPQMRTFIEENRGTLTAGGYIRQLVRLEALRLAKGKK